MNKLKTIDFEEFLSDQCDTHTNNDQAGFDKWLEELDGEQYMEFGQMYAEKVHEQSYLQGKEDMLNEVEKKIINPLRNIQTLPNEVVNELTERN